MATLRTNNPAMHVFAKPQTWDDFFSPGSSAGAVARERPTTMTVQGAVNKTLLLLGLTAATAIATWIALSGTLTLRGASGTTLALAAGGGIVGVILALIMGFRPASAPFLAPIYAVMEGAFVGAVSLLYASNPKWGSPIVLQAGLLTFGILGAMLLAYKMRLIVATDTFRRCIVAATGGLFLMWIVCLVLNLVGVNVGYLWSWGPIGLGIAAVIVVIAALNLVLDFDFIEKGAQASLPRSYEWYAGFALLASLIWLYLSILRLLAMLADRR
jgi:uncharacterized YccA/Bax inhibitor family protein